MSKVDSNPGNQAAESEEPSPAGDGNYEISPGESLSSVAHDTGHFWRKLWDLPENKGLREVREDPEILVPGDRLTVPPIEPRSQAIHTGMLHRFRRLGVPVKVSFNLADQEGKPFAGKSYRLMVGPTVHTGTTDATGLVEHWISPAAKIGRLEVDLADPAYPETASWELSLGQMLPIESTVGVQARLDNLSYPCGPIDGAWGPRCAAALAEFQRDQGVEPTGELDDATRKLLQEVHGN